MMMVMAQNASAVTVLVITMFLAVIVLVRVPVSAALVSRSGLELQVFRRFVAHRVTIHHLKLCG